MLEYYTGFKAQNGSDGRARLRGMSVSQGFFGLLNTSTKFQLKVIALHLELQPFDST